MYRDGKAETGMVFGVSGEQKMKETHLKTYLETHLETQLHETL